VEETERKRDRVKYRRTNRGMERQGESCGARPKGKRQRERDRGKRERKRQRREREKGPKIVVE
jgi:hypothetical protein